MTPLYRLLGAALAIALMAVIVWGSSASLTVHGSTDGQLRLAWSARPERIEQCRQRTEEELARLPQHMRQPLACEGATAEYRLQVRVDGALVFERVVRGGGLRQDRSLYVFHEVTLEPGDTTLEVRLDRLGPDPAPAAPAERSTETPGGPPNRRQPRGEAVPPHLSFERRLRVRPREVILVTYSPERRALVAVHGSAPAARER